MGGTTFLTRSKTASISTSLAVIARKSCKGIGDCDSRERGEREKGKMWKRKREKVKEKKGKGKGKSERE